MNRLSKVLIFVLIALILYMAHIMSLQSHKAISSEEIKSLKANIKSIKTEYQSLLEEQRKSLEENGQLKERLSHYQDLSSFIQDKLKGKNDLSDGQVDKLTSLFWDQVKTYKFDPWEAASWIFQESRFNVTAISSMGAIGLTQIMPATGKQVAGQLGISWEGEKTLLDPEKNMLIGFYYLNWGRNLVSTKNQIYSVYMYGIGNLRRNKLDKTKYSCEILDRAKRLKAA